MKNVFSSDPCGRAAKRIDIFKRKIMQATVKLPEEDERRKIMYALTGIEGCSALLLASDIEARKEASDQIAKLMLAHRRANPDEEYYFITLIDDSGRVSDRSPVIDYERLRRKVYQALRLLHLDGFAAIEVHPLANYPGGGEGRSLLFHAHVIAWGQGKIDPKSAEKKLLQRGAWNNSLGAKAVDVQRIGRDRTDLESVAGYILKPPHCAKNRVPRKKDPTRFKLRDTVKGYRPEFALRLAEVLSQIELVNVVFGIGAGRRVRQQFRAHMLRWHRERAASLNPLAGEFDIWSFWYRLRLGFGSKLYLPVRISRGYRARSVRIPKPRTATEMPRLPKRRPGSRSRPPKAFIKMMKAKRKARRR